MKHILRYPIYIPGQAPIAGTILGWVDIARALTRRLGYAVESDATFQLDSVAWRPLYSLVAEAARTGGGASNIGVEWFRPLKTRIAAWKSMEKEFWTENTFYGSSGEKGRHFRPLFNAAQISYFMPIVGTTPGVPPVPSVSTAIDSYYSTIARGAGPGLDPAYPYVTMSDTGITPSTRIGAMTEYNAKHPIRQEPSTPSTEDASQQQIGYTAIAPIETDGVSLEAHMSFHIDREYAMVDGDSVGTPGFFGASAAHSQGSERCGPWEVMGGWLQVVQHGQEMGTPDYAPNDDMVYQLEVTVSGWKPWSRTIPAGPRMTRARRPLR